MAKGSSYERKICKQLGLWWTDGKSDDVFWRSCQSGGRATQRAKSGKSTFGSYGDIAAVNPIGLPLLELFTIELKRGRSHGHPEDLVDCLPTKVCRPFEKTLMQAFTSHKQAGSNFWMLICQRDRKCSMVYLPREAFAHLDPTGLFPLARYTLLVNREKEVSLAFMFAGLPLDAFLQRFSAKSILAVHKKLR